jgi:hypothetical protein
MQICFRARTLRSNMPPINAPYDSFYCARRNAKPPSEFQSIASVSIRAPNFKNIFLCENVRYVIFSAWRIIMNRPPFRDHVSHVVGLIANKQMIRPNTRRIVATVKDEKAMRYRPATQNPRGVVGENSTSSVLASTNPSVSIRIAVSHILPAPITNSNPRPKSKRERCGTTMRSQILRRNLYHLDSLDSFGLLAQRGFLLLY